MVNDDLRMQNNELCYFMLNLNEDYNNEDMIAIKEYIEEM